MRSARLARLTMMVAALCTLALGACVNRRGAPAGPRPAIAWSEALYEAQRSADSGRYADADRVLDGFARRFPNTMEATEAVYWRALYKLDPANKEATARDAIIVLNAYLAATTPLPRHAEALVLKRSAESLDALSRTALGVPAPRPATPSPTTTGEATRERMREEEAIKEIQRLREELEKTNAELERIKRRLAAPTRPPGQER